MYIFSSIYVFCVGGGIFVRGGGPGGIYVQWHFYEKIGAKKQGGFFKGEKTRSNGFVFSGCSNLPILGLPNTVSASKTGGYV